MRKTSCFSCQLSVLDWIADIEDIFFVNILLAGFFGGFLVKGSQAESRLSSVWKFKHNPSPTVVMYNIYKLTFKFRFNLGNGCNTKSGYVLCFAQYTNNHMDSALLTICNPFDILTSICKQPFILAISPYSPLSPQYKNADM